MPGLNVASSLTKLMRSRNLWSVVSVLLLGFAVVPTTEALTVALPLSIPAPELHQAACAAADLQILECGHELWTQRVDGAHGEDSAERIVMSHTEAIVAGPSGGGILVVSEALADGAARWSRLLPNRANFFGPRAIGLQLSPDESAVFVTGGVSCGNQDCYAVSSIRAATGDVLWTTLFPSGLNDGLLDLALTLSKDGTRVYAVFETVAQTEVFSLAALDARIGTVEWQTKVDVGTPNGAPRMAAHPNGDGVLLALPVQEANHLDVAVARYDSRGVQKWTATMEAGDAQFIDLAAGVVFSPEGSTDYAVISGCDVDCAPTIVLVAAFDDASGLRRWEDNEPGAVASGVAISPDGSRVFIGGTVAPEGLPQALTSSAYLVMAENVADGTRAWTAWYTGPVLAGLTENDGLGIDVAPNGSRVYVTGRSKVALGAFVQTLGSDVVTVAFEASDGSTAWVARYDGPLHGDDDGHAIRVAEDGRRVIVVGTSVTGVQLYDPVGLLIAVPTPTVGSGHDFLTIAYSA